MEELAESAIGMLMHSQSLVLRGRLLDGDWKLFLAKCTEAIGMTPVCEAAVWNYPIEGRGGVGMTAFQPLMESFIALDTWSDHDGAYLFIASCRKFDVSQLAKTIREFALGVVDSGAPSTLRLK